MGRFLCYRFGAGVPGRFFLLAVIGCSAEIGNPLFYDFTASGLDNHHDVPKGSCGNVGIVMTEVAAAGGGDPDLCGIGSWRALGDMDVHRLQGIAFV